MTDPLPLIDPARAALLVMDYQPGILGSLDNAEELLSRVAEVIAEARRLGVHVGYVRVAFADDDFANIPSTSQFAAIAAGRGRTLHAEDPGTAVHERIAPEPGDIVVRKTRVGAFSTTDLHEQLQARGVTTLILAGISTSGVVLSTVRDARDRDYELVVLADACADHDAVVHEVLTERVFPRQATVITAAELPALLAR